MKKFLFNPDGSPNLLFLLGVFVISVICASTLFWFVTKKSSASKFGAVPVDAAVPVDEAVPVDAVASPVVNNAPIKSIWKLTFESPESRRTIAQTLVDKYASLKESQKEEGSSELVISQSQNINIYFRVISSNNPSYQGIKLLTQPVLVLSVPEDVNDINLIEESMLMTIKTYINSTRRFAEQPHTRPNGQIDIRIEGDVIPSVMRSRIEFLNINMALHVPLPVTLKYVKKSNPVRPVNDVFVYVSGFTSDAFDGFNTDDRQMLREKIKPGMFLGRLNAVQFINGYADDKRYQSPMFLKELEDVDKIFKPFFDYLGGTGPQPSEDTILADLGCPPPPPVIPCPSCPTFDVATMCPKQVCPTFDVASMCPSKPVWPLKAPVPATAKTFNMYYTSSKTNSSMMSALIEAVQMRITFAEKPNANLKAVNKTGYNTNEIGIEINGLTDPKTKKPTIKKIKIVTSDVRKGVEDIYAILAPYL
jgi:hypothetical protein